MTAATLPSIIANARRGTNLDDRCSVVLPQDPGFHPRMCIDCGRVTTRRNEDGFNRCLGVLPEFPWCAVCTEPMTVTAAGQKTHPSCSPKSRRLMAITRELERLGLPYCTCADVKDPARDCAHCKEFAQRLIERQRAQVAYP